jgi:electron transfer flavoprotein alpha subunit
MNTLVWVEHEAGAIRDATLSTITAAANLGDVDLIVTGTDLDAAAAAAAAIAGISCVYVCDDDTLRHGLAETVAPVIVALMQTHDAFLVAATSAGKNLAPRVAALLDVVQISEIVAVNADGSFDRPIYAGNAIATVRSRDPKIVVSVRPTAFAKAPPQGGTATVEVLSPPNARPTSRFVGAETAQSDRPELTSAKVVVAGGRALKDAATFEGTLAPLADKLGAAIGASRAAVDAGYAANDLQVGQTGKIVAPDLYIAVGISGAIQHLAGMKDSKTIIAINKDEDAPIFQVADIGLVGDLYEIVPQLLAKI